MRIIFSAGTWVSLIFFILQGCAGTIVQRHKGVVVHQTENAAGLMVGFPPPPDRRVSTDNWQNTPYNSWGFFNVSKFLPTTSIRRGFRPAKILIRWTKNIDLITFDDREGNLMSVGQMLKATHTDGFIVTKDRKIISEQYFNGMQPAARHIIWSCSQAIIGSLVGVFVNNGQLDLNASVAEYIPELARSGFGDATLRQVLDMQVALDYSEDFNTDAAPNVRQLYRAAGFGPARTPEEDSIYAFLPTIGKKGEHGVVFQYATPNTEVLGWILERVSGKSLAQLLSDRIWAQLGAERDAYSVVNRVGGVSPGGGINLTLRDFARFGLMHQYNGRFNNRQIIPDTWINDIESDANRSAFKKNTAARLFPQGSYRNQWWVSGNPHRAYMAIGIYGQFLYINPKSKIVIAKMSSYPKPVNPEFTFITLKAFEAISSSLEKI